MRKRDWFINIAAAALFALAFLQVPATVAANEKKSGENSISIVKTVDKSSPR